jgi:hypothetical protein
VQLFIGALMLVFGAGLVVDAFLRSRGRTRLGVVAATLAGLVIRLVLPAQAVPHPTPVGARGLVAAIVPTAFFVAVTAAAIWRGRPRRPATLYALGVAGGLVVGLAEAGAYGPLYAAIVPPVASGLEAALLLSVVVPGGRPRPTTRVRDGGGGPSGPADEE